MNCSQTDRTQIKVSLCVPVYNVEPFIDKCASSLFAQDVTEQIEYIFVDDCSTDNSIATLERLLDENPDHKKRTTIIRQEQNKGPQAARLEAVRIACGQYVCFCDSDDYVQPDYVSTMLNEATEKDADIVYCNITELFANGDTQSTHYSQLTLQSYIRNDQFSYICGKLYKRSIFESVCTDREMQYFEDRMTTFRLLLKEPKIAFVDKPLYIYVRYNPQSMTGHAKLSRRVPQDLMTYWQKVDDLLREKGLTEKYEEDVAYAKIRDKAHVMLFCGSNEIRKKYADIFAEEERQQTKKFSIGRQLMLWAVRNRLWTLCYAQQKLMDLRRLMRQFKTSKH